MEVLDHLAYAAAWASFGAGHSWLAGAGPAGRFGALFGAATRLAYNAVAVAHVAAVVAVGYWLLGDRPAFAWLAGLRPVMVVVNIAAWAALLWSLGYYDLGRFAGTVQLRAARQGETLDDDEPLRTDGPHAYVRHPLYAAAYLVLWSAAWTPLALATAVWASFYLAVGTRLEEHRLLARYGQAYADYQAKVPALVPWKGKVL